MTRQPDLAGEPAVIMNPSRALVVAKTGRADMNYFAKQSYL